jgi:hypothetical protein
LPTGVALHAGSGIPERAFGCFCAMNSRTSMAAEARVQVPKPIKPMNDIVLLTLIAAWEAFVQTS